MVHLNKSIDCSMEKNNFQNMMEEFEGGMPEENKESIRSNIWSVLNIFKYFGTFTDLYISKFIKFMMGGVGEEEKPYELPTQMIFPQELDESLDLDEANDEKSED